ncbi:MAG TPA: DNA mismatch repair endonuclease MutL, partial [Candidatus Polarisedimenticolia bacterium]|nr:DNA mismatch repair endonuclease MutL [Candidatus Polarisedimenticolia bacterium]
MAPIRVLDPSVIGKIRAGEVVDRPAAVTKELIENALDAGSSLVAVHAASHPERLIRVQDDGSGMSREDALLALRRHATSKIESAEDLAQIRSLGFRGEALASIAEVSRLSLSTRSSEDLTGTQVEALGGAVIQVSGVGRAVGTTVVVEDLFFNTPARLRFLKSREAEIRVLSRVVWNYALTYPRVHWKFSVEGREDTDLPEARDLLERWEVLYGRGPEDGSAEFDHESGGVHVSGVLGAPEQARASRDYQTFAVNGRVIASATLAAALRQGYGNLLPGDRYPLALVMIEIDPAQVDANVHPTKREVRFRDEARIFQVLRRAVEAAMRRHIPAGISFGDASGVGEPREPGYGAAGGVATLVSGSVVTETRPAVGSEAALHLALETTGGIDVREKEQGDLEESLAEPEIAIWQLHERYLLAPIRGGMVIVDQHAAHERILYEEARAHLYSGTGASQVLLFPRIVDLTPADLDALLMMEPHLRRLGYEASLFGERQVAVRGVPASIPEEAAIDSLRAVLASVDSLGEEGEAPEEHIAKSFACHAAVRSGQPLSPIERRALFDRLFATSLPHGDPHGR